MKNLTDKELIQMLANAESTGAECGGHHKAEMNEMKAKEYTKELESRGVTIPSIDELYSIGIFN